MNVWSDLSVAYLEWKVGYPFVWFSSCKTRSNYRNLTCDFIILYLTKNNKKKLCDGVKDVLATSVEWRYISFILDIFAASPIVRCIIDTNTMNYNGSEKKTLGHGSLA